MRDRRGVYRTFAIFVHGPNATTVTSLGILSTAAIKKSTAKDSCALPDGAAGLVFPSPSAPCTKSAGTGSSPFKKRHHVSASCG
jgi:hypothetical protein